MLQPLPAHEQIALCRRAQQGDAAARHRLVQTNLRFVYQQARAFTKKTPLLEPDDILSAGVVGLLDAIERFDFSRSDNYVSYAQHWVLLRMREAVVQIAIQITAPVDVLTRVWSNRFAKDRQRLLDSGVDPAQVDAQVAKSHSMLPERLLAAEGLRSPVVSLDQPLRDEDPTTTLHDILVTHHGPSVDVRLADAAWIAQLHVAVALMASGLPYTRRFVVAQRIVEGRSLAAVARMLDISAERVRQIERDLRLQLRQLLVARFPSELGRRNQAFLASKKSMRSRLCAAVSAPKSGQAGA